MNINTDTVIRNARYICSDEISARSLRFSGGRIVEDSSERALEFDLTDHLVFPGLINAHDHLHLNCFPSLTGEELFRNSYEWIDSLQNLMLSPEYIAAKAVPLEQRLWQGALKNLLSGVTTVAHHDPYHKIFDEANFPVQVLKQFGWSHSLGLGLSNSIRSPLNYGPTVQESFASTPSSNPWMIHLAEGTDETAESEFNELVNLECLAANTVLIHGVGLSNADIQRVIDCGAGVVWCPTSNLKMLGKTLSAKALLDSQRVALGTDSRLTGGHDLLEEIKQIYANGYVSGRDIVNLVTTSSSQLLLAPDIGTLKFGSRADILILREDSSPAWESLLKVDRAGIRAVIRGGKPAVADEDFEEWFVETGTHFTPIMLDGCRKLCATSYLGKPGYAELEPGLDRWAA